MNKKKYLAAFIISFIAASIAGNFTEKKVRGWIEVIYEVVMGYPMVSDISQCDENGVPFVIERTIGKQRNPMTVCNKALYYHNRFLKGDSSQKVLFLNCADWLESDLTLQKNFGVLKYAYNWPMYNMVAPWRSGLANGVSLQVFVKAHALSGNTKYLSDAKQVLNSFFVEVKDGGVTYESKDNGWWFEEFADEEGVVSRVLNGHVFALLGIHEYYTYTHDSSANYLFHQGLLALTKTLPKYDKGGGHSWYDLRGTPANNKYHFIHVDLLDRLYHITEDKVCKFYADKWRSYTPPSLTRRLIMGPVKRIDMTIWFFNFVCTSIITAIGFYVFVKKKESINGHKAD